MTRNNPDVSIVVPTYNRQELLPLSLPALARLRTSGFTYEVVFANDGSTDGTAEMIEEASRNWPEKFRLLSLPHSGSPARPRNAGIREARGLVVVLLDDDIVPDPNFLMEHWHFHQSHPEANVLATGELYQPEEVLADPLSLFHSFPYHELRGHEPLGFLFYWSCNISGKANFLKEHGLFDEDPALHPVEDMEWGYRLTKCGGKLMFLPSARGKHLHKMDASGVVPKGERTGRAQFALTQKVPDPAIKMRFGIVSSDLSLGQIAWRGVRRSAFRVVDNPVTIAILRLLGAEKARRNWITDSYYYLIFRRSTVEGYKQARRESRRKLSLLERSAAPRKEA